MNAQVIEELQAKLATAMGLVTEVQSEVHKHMGYLSSRKVSRRAVEEITRLSEALDLEWRKDEVEFDEDLGHFP